MKLCKHALAVYCGGYDHIAMCDKIRYIRTSDFDVPQTFWTLFFDLKAEPFEFCPLCGEDLSEWWLFRGE